MLDLLFLNNPGSPRINTRLAEVAGSSLQHLSSLLCTIPKTLLLIHMNCVPTHSVFALLLVGTLEPPADEVSDALSLGP